MARYSGGGHKATNNNTSLRHSNHQPSNRTSSARPRHHKEVEKECSGFNWTPGVVLALIGAATWLNYDFDKKKKEKEAKEKARREREERYRDDDRDGYYDDQASYGGYDRGYDRRFGGSDAGYSEMSRGRSRERRRYGDDYDDGYYDYESRRTRSR